MRDAPAHPVCWRPSSKWFQPMSPCGAPSRPPPSLCGTSALSESRHIRAWDAQSQLAARAAFLAACGMHRRVPWCSRNGALQFVTAIRTRSHRTPHGQVQRSQSSPLGQSVQGAAGKAKDDPPFSITRSSLHRACRPALVPVSMAWAAACMLQGNVLALGASRSSPIPTIPTLTGIARSHLLPCLHHGISPYSVGRCR